MTPEAQNIAIAQALGHKFHKPSEEQVKSGSYYQYEPNYVGDLNSMHDAEKVLKGQEPVKYGKQLKEIVARDYCGLSPESYYWHATAAQRAEAFLKVIGKWVEE